MALRLWLRVYIILVAAMAMVVITVASAIGSVINVGIVIVLAVENGIA